MLMCVPQKNVEQAQKRTKHARTRNKARSGTACRPSRLLRIDASLHSDWPSPAKGAPPAWRECRIEHAECRFCFDSLPCVFRVSHCFSQMSGVTSDMPDSGRTGQNDREEANACCQWMLQSACHCHCQLIPAACAPRFRSVPHSRRCTAHGITITARSTDGGTSNRPA